MGRLVLVACCAALAGCGDDLKTFEEPPSRVELDQGERFALDFTVNPSVGWDWRLDGKLPPVVELEDTEVEIDDPESDGSDGTKRFIFRAVRSGEGTVRMERNYRGEKIDDRHSATVEVR